MDYRYQNGELGFDAVHVCDCTLCEVETEWQAVRFGPATAKEYEQSEFIWKVYGPIIWKVYGP